MAHFDIEHFTVLQCSPNFVTDIIILIYYKFIVIMVWNIVNYSNMSYTYTIK